MTDTVQKTAPWQSLRIQNNRGQQLAGLWLPSLSAHELTLVVCHGFTGSKESGGKTLRMAERFAQSGVSTMIFDFAGNGESQGRFEDISLSGQMDDLSCVLDWCRQRRPEEPLVTLGRSFGGTTVICQAAADPRVSAVCSWAAPADPGALFSGFCQKIPEDPGYCLLSSEEGSVRIREDFFTDLQRHDVLKAAAGISPRPLLILHGRLDDVVPLRSAEAIYAAAGQPKELRTIDGAGHRLSESPERIREICLGWLKEVGGKTRGSRLGRTTSAAAGTG